MTGASLWTWRQPFVRGWHDDLEALGWRRCGCGHWHTPGSRAIERHRQRLMGPEVLTVCFGWPVGDVVFRRVERSAAERQG